MVDVGAKMETRRSATATGTIRMQAGTLALIESGTAKKGDVLGVARIAAIQAAKRTSDLIPLCQPLALTRVAVDFRIDSEVVAVHCTATVETLSRTGVEKEALTSVQIGLLTIYDMCKATDRGMCMTDIRLQEKHGGKSGSYCAAVGLANLPKWPASADARAALYARYRAMLEGIGGLEPTWQRTPPHLIRTLLCFRVRTSGIREAIETACRAVNIETRRWYLPLINHHDGLTELPVAVPLTAASAISTDLVGLPFHNRLDGTALATIRDAVERATGPGR